MKTLSEFDYQAFEEVTATLNFLASHGDECEILGGGTDVFVLMRGDVIKKNFVLDIKRVPDFCQIVIDDQENLHIGAACTISDIEKSELVQKYAPILVKVADNFANAQIRNRATIGGNVGRSSPAGDTLPALLVLDAKVRLLNANGERTVALNDFFTGPGENIMRSNELISEIIIPASQGGKAYTAFNKMMRTGCDLSKINAAAYLELDNDVIKTARVAVGSVAPVPKRLKLVEKELKGVRAAEDVFNEAVKKVAAEIEPITDARSTKDYRAQTTGILVKRTLEDALKGVQ